MLISASEDGTLIADAVRSLNVVPVRGSSSRKGSEARTVLLDALQQGHNIGITPDGPKGPAKVIKPGVTWLAQQSGAPIIPLALRFTRGTRVGSWDRFQIPWIGSRVDLYAGDAIRLTSGDFALAHDDVATKLLAFWQSIDPEDPTFD